MQIKKQTDQSIRILLHLANSRQKLTGKELAGLVGVSEKFLPYIMQRLRMAGLVSSTSGIGGGYLLARNADEITLHDVMVAVGDEPLISCYAEDDNNSAYRFGSSDVLLNQYDFIQDITTRYFDSLTIWDLSEPKQREAIHSRMELIREAVQANAPSRGGGSS